MVCENIRLLQKELYLCCVSLCDDLFIAIRISLSHVAVVTANFCGGFVLLLAFITLLLVRHV
jgi:hypothetical protein